MPFQFAYRTLHFHRDQLDCKRIILTRMSPDLLDRQADAEFDCDYDGMAGFEHRDDAERILALPTTPCLATATRSSSGVNAGGGEGANGLRDRPYASEPWRTIAEVGPP